MKNRAFLVVLSIAAVAAAAGCTSFERESSNSLTSPTAAGNSSLLGAWTSSSIIPSPSTCSSFVWTVSEQTQTSARGSFSATCAGDLRLTGTAEGSFSNPTTIVWKASGNATGPGLTSCAIAIGGSATVGTEAISIPYSGTTCLGNVSGIESIRRRGV